ncbi:HAD-IA family hydrolase [Acidaminococcus massiliensis]|uniref:HAD-IA family hydrolase n=1 Tax=Acidaminococcus massiliensis TaxID=1852375 RepID=UPI003521AAB3
MNLKIYDEIKKETEKYQYVSFDLFDTLIKRDCFRPIELFHILEEKINLSYQVKINFAEKRIQAEKKAREISSYEEVTLDEIYMQLKDNFSSEQIGNIKQWEQELELNLCQWNPLMRDVYNYCKQQEKNILIVTDIYLPQNLIERILDKLQIQYKFLFVSSVERKTKNKGGVFQRVLEKLGCQPYEIFHIGDNHESDYLIPHKLGIAAIQIPRESKINLFIQKKTYKKSHEYANLCSFINNHSNLHTWDAVHKKNGLDYFFQAGYEAQGPLLYSFVRWLEEQIKKMKIDKVFFLARDGQIMQKAFNILNDTIPNFYMYASRRALITPSLWMQPELKEVIQSITFLEKEKISSILKRIGLQPEHYRKFFEGTKFNWEIEYNSRELFKDIDFKNLYNVYIKPDMITSSKKQYQKLITYLNQIDFKGKVAIVDIGWFGNMQRALNKVIDKAKIPAKVQGFYLGLNPFEKVLGDDAAHGFLFDRDYNVNLFRKERMFNSLFEILFTANHGTTLGYKEQDSKITPVLDCWEYEKVELQSDYKKIDATQKGALEFIKDITSAISFDLINTPQISFMNWICLGFYPDQKCANRFGALHMLDDEISCIAEPQTNGYGIHVGHLLKDLKKSLWQIGFLTILYGDKILYGDLYYLFRDIVKGKHLC